MQLRPRAPRATHDRSATTSHNGTTSSPSSRTVLKSAPPPWHSVALMAIMLMVFVALLPSLESLDRDATPEVFTQILFPNLLSVRQLALCRLTIAAIIWIMSIRTIMGPGWVQETTYRPHSKLLRTPNTLRGIRTMFPFTSVSWNILGIYFTLSGLITLRAADPGPHGLNRFPLSPWLLRTAMVTWEVSAPCTLLVAAVIRYAIWPTVLAAKANTANLKTFRNIMMHNANVLFAATEVALLGGVPVWPRYLVFAPLVGCAYVLFSWLMVHSWNTPDKGPQFIYFFFDTTLGLDATKALLVLLLVLVAFYALFCGAEQLLQWLGSSLVAHVGFVAVVCSLTMRFRD